MQRGTWPRLPPPPIIARSLASVVRATFQPSPTSPTHVRGRDAHVVEEDLVEVVGPAGLAQRAHVDAGRTHVDDEVRDAPVLRGVEVGAGEQDGPVGRPGAGVPHLLAVDHPLVAVAHGAGAQRREVGAGAGLAVELAPDLLAADDLVEVVGALLLGAVGHQGRARPS